MSQTKPKRSRVRKGADSTSTPKLRKKRRCDVGHKILDHAIQPSEFFDHGPNLARAGTLFATDLRLTHPGWPILRRNFR